jgi:hypothetical protein
MAACGADDPEERGPDAETDASTDAGGDASGDSGGDGGSDGGGDGGDDTDIAPDTDDVASADGSGDTTTPDPCAEACADLALRSADDCGADNADEFESACLTLCRGPLADEVVEASATDGNPIPDEAVRLVAWLADIGSTCENAGCGDVAGLYTPAEGGEAWGGGACVSDAGDYVQIEENVSTIGRVAAFEQIGDLLWRSADVPTADDFIAARELYAADEGLDSRVQRREDEHYPPVTDGEGTVLQCRDAGVPELDPDRCVGPALILPVINQAFQDGINGVEPRLAAARLESALLWFFYLSSFKESRTCETVAKDCDSSWAYYTGGQQRDGGLGLAAAVRDASPAAHDAIFDGILAMRCWRDIDSEPAATDAVLHDRATAQLDQALHYGYSRLLAARLADYAAAEGESKEILGAFIEVAAPVLVREIAERDAAAGAAYEVLLDAGPESYDAAALIDLVLRAIPCPE